MLNHAFSPSHFALQHQLWDQPTHCGQPNPRKPHNPIFTASFGSGFLAVTPSRLAGGTHMHTMLINHWIAPFKTDIWSSSAKVCMYLGFCPQMMQQQNADSIIGLARVTRFGQATSCKNCLLEHMRKGLAGHKSTLSGLRGQCNNATQPHATLG